MTPKPYFIIFQSGNRGFTYKVKAKFVLAPEGLQDSAAYYFEFQKIISQEKYTGNESFNIQLIKSYIPVGPFIQLGKDGNKFFYIPNKIQLTSGSSEVSKQSDTIWKNVDEIRKNSNPPQSIKWKQITATVKPDPNKFGKAYLAGNRAFIGKKISSAQSDGLNFI